MMRKQSLKDYKLPKDFKRGKNFLVEACWVLLFSPIISCFIPGSKWRGYILKFFGAEIGESVRFNRGLKVKMPWRLSIGNFCWIGEETWFDNIANIKIANNVCISQGVYFCTGNHNYKKSSFDLIYKPILIEDEVWIGAKSIIAPGYKIGKGSVITIGSIIKKDIPEYSVFKNNSIFNIYKK